MTDPTPDQQPFRGFRSPNYTPVPDELFDEVLSQVSGAELKVALYIIRRTFGFKKSQEAISLKQIRSGITTRDGRVLDRGTGLSLSATQTALKGLVAKGIITAQRHRSAQRGDEATTYALHMADPANQAISSVSSLPARTENATSPVTEHRQGGLPISGNGGYRKSAPQETVLKQTDVSVRISTATRQEAGEPGAPSLAAGHTQPPPAARTGSLRSLAEVLDKRQPLASRTEPAPVDQAPVPQMLPQPSVLASRQPHRGRIRPTPQIAVAVTEVSQEFGDLKHLAANSTQAMHLWQDAATSEARFVSILYEARSITRQQQHVVKRIAYFWRVVRDLLDIPRGTTTLPALSG